MSNLEIDNSLIKISTGSVSISPKSDNTKLSQSSTSVPMTDAKKMALLKKLGISVAQYDAIKLQCPDFDTKSFAEQLEIASKPTQVAVSDNKKVEAKTIKTEASEVKDIKAEYNKQNLNGKIETCYSEFAKNTFIYGVKDKNNVIAQSHSKEAWDKLSDTEKKEYVDKVKAFIDNNDKLQNIKTNFSEKVSDKGKELAIDALMRTIQAANAEGISSVDLMKKDEYERKELIEDYLVAERKQNPENLNKNDEEYLAQSKMLKEQVTNVVEQKTGEKIGDNLDPKSVGMYIKYYNLSEDELLYSALKDKIKTGRNLTDDEKFQYDTYTKIITEPSGQQIIKEAKAQNISDMKAEFDSFSDKIKNGEKLSPEEQKSYDLMKETLNSKEGKELLKYAKILPQPKTENEKKVAADVENYKAQIKDYIHGSDLEASTAVQFIDTKTEGMSKDEKVEYIANFIKFNRSLSSSRVFAKYMKEYPELSGRLEALNAASSNYTEMDAVQRANFNKTKVEAANSNDKYTRETGINAANTVSNILSSDEYKKVEFDEMKLENAESNSKIKDTNVLKNTTKANATIKNAETAVKAQAYIINSEGFNDEVAIYTADKAKDFAVGAQAKVLNMTTERSAAATKYVAENDIISTLNPNAQAEAFDGTYNNINKHFEGKEADKYSQSLTSQIKGLDSKAQVDALSTVYKSGNEKAIAVAANDVLPAIKSPDVQQIVLKQAVMEFAGVSDNPEIQAMFENGTLSKAQIAQLSSSERREYYVKMFDNASVADKIKILKSLPDGKSKQTVYNLIGTYYKNTFKSLIESDVATAESMYNMGLKQDLQNIITSTIMFKAETNASFKFLRDRLHINDVSDLAKENTEPATAKTISYSSIPNNFDTKELFKKDKNGILLA